MPATFLHGVETIEVPSGYGVISVVKSAVIALVGIAPTGDKNVLKLVASPEDAAQFGSELPGFNIPKALSAIFKQGSGTVLVANVFDTTEHTTQVTAETHAVTLGKAKLTFAPIDEPVITNTGATVTYVKDTDYSIDVFGNITVIAGSAIVEGQDILCTYKKLNDAAVTSDEIIGELDALTGARSGMQLFDLAYTLFGFKPKLLIAPGYSTVDAIATEMIVKSNKYRAFSLIDAPEAAIVSDVITARAPGGDWAGFNGYDKRVIPLYPMIKAYDADSDANILTPYSQWLAGVIAATDLNFGYWYSPSNKPILGIIDTEVPIQFDITDSTSEANRLNEVGVVTVRSGLKTWGNRSAGFPNSSEPLTFIAVQRTADIVDESIEFFTDPYLDEPGTPAFVDFIRESVNGFIRTLIGRGALLDGSKCIFDPAKNPAAEIALGHYTFTNKYAVPTPAGRITFEREIDINLYANVNPQ